jgi:hypothetical protein
MTTRGAIFIFCSHPFEGRMRALFCNKLQDDLGPIFQKKRKGVKEIRVSYFCNPNCEDIQFSIKGKKR